MNRVLVWIALVAAVLAVVVPPVWATYTRFTQGSWPAWSGIGEYVNPKGVVEERAKTLWDLWELLIIPVVLAGGAVLFNRSERESEREIAAERARSEREIATDRLREDALQTYLDRMTELLLEKGLRTSEQGDDVRDVARARTLTVLRGLDGTRKGLLLRFLYESDLVMIETTIVYLQGADLSNAILDGARLGAAHLVGANLAKANLARADLSGANLGGANLGGANLAGADLEGANLGWADLGGANLRHANLMNSELRNANLMLAQLRNSNLFGARLIGASMNGADLTEAKVSDAQLAEGLLLRGAIMPDGSRYDGRFNLKDDIEWAQDVGIDTADPEARRRWYAG